MGKKIKPSSLLDEALAENAEVLLDNGATNANANNGSDANEFVDASLVGNGVMTAESKAKLEKYDALEKSVSSLAKEKEMLEAKVAEYAEKLEKLQNAADEIAKLTTENDALKKQVDAQKSSAKSAFLLEDKVKALREEADGYLVKISELTFENANLTCQLDELSKKMSASGKVLNQQQFSIADAAPPIQGNLRQPSTDAYNPYANNGYGTWR